MREILEKIVNIFAEFATNLGWLYNCIDIIIISVFVYFLLLFLKKQNAGGIIKYAFFALGAFIIILIFQNQLQSTAKVVLNFSLIAIALIFVLFPHEIRRLLWKASSPKETQLTFTNKFDCSDEELRAAISDIVHAAQTMSKRNTGALLVFSNNTLPQQVIESGVKLNALLSEELIESIFITKGPLHDGAMIISGNRIVAAGCFLPLSQDPDLPKELGTRHRAAKGITENSAVTAIIVSEETGIISAAKGGELTRYCDSNMLSEILEQTYGLKAVTASKKKRKK